MHILGRRRRSVEKKKEKKGEPAGTTRMKPKNVRIYEIPYAFVVGG